MIRHEIDPADLSAYYDGALDQDEGARVEAHLAHCPSCRRRLEEYGRIGDALRLEGDPPIPLTVDLRVRSLLRAQVDPRARRRLPSLWVPRPVMAAVLLASLLVVALLAGLPIGGGSPGPMVAAAYLYNDQGAPAIEVQFNGTVDRESIARSVQIEPAADVAVSWRDNSTMVIKPTKPLQPSEQYTVKLKPNGVESASTPVALQFAAQLPASPVPLSTRAPVVGSAPSSASVASTGNSSSTPVTPVASTTPSTPSATTPATKTTGGATTVASVASGPAAATTVTRTPAAATGNTTPTVSTAAATQTGTPTPTVQAKGTSAPTTASATPTSTMTPSATPTTHRNTSTTITPTPTTSTATPAPVTTTPTAGTATPTIYTTPTASTPTPTATPPTDSRGETATPEATTTTTPTETVAPEATATSTPDATTTSTPTGTSTPHTVTSAAPATSPTPTTEPAATPTPTPTPVPVPVKGIGMVYDQHPWVAFQLGAARTNELSVQLTRETFERGTMLSRSDTFEVYALQPDGNWLLYRDSWQKGETLSYGTPPPPGMLAPIHGFGKLWLEEPELRQSFGWATAPEQSLTGVVQEFAGGEMIDTSDHVIYVMYQDGTWQSFPDPYPTPTPTATPTTVSP